jgi:hypothetical protein
MRIEVTQYPGSYSSVVETSPDHQVERMSLGRSMVKAVLRPTDLGALSGSACTVPGYLD